MRSASKRKAAASLQRAAPKVRRTAKPATAQQLRSAVLEEQRKYDVAHAADRDRVVPSDMEMVSDLLPESPTALQPQVPSPHRLHALFPPLILVLCDCFPYSHTSHQWAVLQSRRTIATHLLPSRHHPRHPSHRRRQRRWCLHWRRPARSELSHPPAA